VNTDDASRDSQNVKVGWVLSMDRSNAASRIQGHLVHEWLAGEGVDSVILTEFFQTVSSPLDWRFIKVVFKMRFGGFSHIVFESPEWAACQLSTIWKLLGGISICVRCDNVKGRYDHYFDKTILPTKTLADALNIKRRDIIPDCVETPSGLFKRDYSVSAKVQVAWVGHQTYKNYITHLVDSLEKNCFIKDNFKFVLISKGEFADHQWSESTVHQNILNCDIAFLPIPSGDWFVGKSSNRLAMMMALGMPTIASPIPSYSEIGENGRNVIFFKNEAEILEAFRMLLNSVHRERLGTTAKADLGDRFSFDKIGPHWLRSIASTVNSIKCMEPFPFKIKLYAKFLQLF
jgi:glycosyltransferase involved in cell wall biosynthesis